jgi:transcriptional regulator with XRE-family HTH domain
MTRRGNRGPTPADVRFGKKLRTRRLMLGLTQTELGAAINVTFQQIQKYERGRSRVSASTLEKLAGTLGVPITYFFEQNGGDDGSTAALNAFLASAGVLLASRLVAFVFVFANVASSTREAARASP